MNKKLSFALIFFMSLSLIGIIFVQGYWISESVVNKREQFVFNVKQALIATTAHIQEREYEDNFYPYKTLIDSIGVPDDQTFDEFFLVQEDLEANELFLYRNGILQQDVKLAPAGFDEEYDSLTYTRFYKRKVTQILDRNYLDGDITNGSSDDRREEFVRLTDFERYNYQSIIAESQKRVPIHRRVSVTEIKRILGMKLADRGVETDFEFGVYSNGLATKITSEDFSLEGGIPTYSFQLFADNDGVSNFELYANFPGEKVFVYSEIYVMVIMSIIFTLIIIIAYTNTLAQLNKQRQISQIKTDFINNMTHEFKTPIATINLALDSIKNPKIADDKEKVANYHRMIREENRRMHAQVENVLRISKLEKRELDLRKERIKLHDLIEDAVSHISLILDDRGGTVTVHLDAAKSSILANDSHFTNVIINLLDNAVKYSPSEPIIDVYTENVKNFIILKVQDRGEGMSKSVQRKIFEKFYREHTGNIHNVKGHGLGLSYVKQIVDDHNGEIYVESEKGKGSTFIIKLPLIS